MSPSEDFMARWRAALADRKTQKAQTRGFVALARSGKVPALVEYRCPRRCLLLRVWASSAGPILDTPLYHYSPDAAARQGAPRQSYPARAYPLAPVLDWDDPGQPRTVAVQVQCRHLVRRLDPDGLAADAKAGARGTVRRKLNGPGA